MAKGESFYKFGKCLHARSTTPRKEIPQKRERNCHVAYFTLPVGSVLLVVNIVVVWLVFWPAISRDWSPLLVAWLLRSQPAAPTASINHPVSRGHRYAARLSLPVHLRFHPSQKTRLRTIPVKTWNCTDECVAAWYRLRLCSSTDRNNLKSIRNITLEVQDSHRAE